MKSAFPLRHSSSLRDIFLLQAVPLIILSSSCPNIFATLLIAFSLLNFLVTENSSPYVSHVIPLHGFKFHLWGNNTKIYLQPEHLKFIKELLMYTSKTFSTSLFNLNNTTTDSTSQTKTQQPPIDAAAAHPIRAAFKNTYGIHPLPLQPTLTCLI